jgi:hypothetical protein
MSESCGLTVAAALARLGDLAALLCGPGRPAARTARALAAAAARIAAYLLARANGARARRRSAG